MRWKKQKQKKNCKKQNGLKFKCKSIESIERSILDCMISKKNDSFFKKRPMLEEFFFFFFGLRWGVIEIQFKTYHIAQHLWIQWMPTKWQANAFFFFFAFQFFFFFFVVLQNFFFFFFSDITTLFCKSERSLQKTKNLCFIILIELVLHQLVSFHSLCLSLLLLLNFFPIPSMVLFRLLL